VDRGEGKPGYVEQLGPGARVAIGSGRNDVPMLHTAALGIAVIGPEGASARAAEAADGSCARCPEALGLLAQPRTLTATLWA
jgi:soluble P-type ATPase